MADASSAKCPVFNPFSDELIASPYASYGGLRDQEGLHWSPMLQAWVVTRMADVRDVMADSGFVGVDVAGILVELSRRARRHYPYLVRFLNAVLFFKDGPVHAQERRTVAKIINAVKLSRLESVVQTLTDDLVRRMKENQKVDAIRDFAEPLPQAVMGYILGIPDEDLPALNELLCDVTLIFDPASLATYDRLEVKAKDALDLIRTRIEYAVKAGLGNGLCQIYENAPGEGLERYENAAATTIFVFRVGAETTVGLLGLMIRYLVDQPELIAAAKADPTVVELITSEILRLESNVQRAGRIATRDICIAGTQIRSGDRVLLLIGSANRDPSCFPTPDLVQLDANRPPDLSFGAGKHFCLGASLARTEARIACQAFIGLAPLERDGDDEWFQSRTIRRLTKLPIRIGT